MIHIAHICHLNAQNTTPCSERECVQNSDGWARFQECFDVELDVDTWRSSLKKKKKKAGLILKVVTSRFINAVRCSEVGPVQILFAGCL